MKNFKTISTIIFYTIIIFIFLDIVILRHCCHFGIVAIDTYGSDKSDRKYQPYFEFMNGHILKNNTSTDNIEFFQEDNRIKVALFGGSTGLPLDEGIFSETLAKYLAKEVQVVNFSCSSASHRQHLHMILEVLPKYNPDIIIFYGGYNETIQHYLYEPRPGFPYNYYYKHDTPPLLQFLIENSALFSTIEMRYRSLTNYKKLAAEYNVFSEEYNQKIIDKYFETLMLAKNVTSTLQSKEYGNTKFIAFYQPYRVPEYFEESNKRIEDKIKNIDYIFDVHDEYKNFDDSIWIDYCHVKDEPEVTKHIIDVLSKTTAEYVSKSKT